MNSNLYELMVQAGYAAPNMAPRAQRLAVALILLCAELAAENPHYAERKIRALLDDENFSK